MNELTSCPIFLKLCSCTTVSGLSVWSVVIMTGSKYWHDTLTERSGIDGDC